jgi:hypothetical protein
MQSEIDSEINLKQYQSEIAVLRACFHWLSHAVAKIQLGLELEFVPSAAPRITPFSDKGRIVAGHRFRSPCPFAPALGAALPPSYAHFGKVGPVGLPAVAFRCGRSGLARAG